MTATEINLEKEISSLRKAGRDREQDLETLNSVLQCNQDLINVRTFTDTYSPVNGCALCSTRLHIKVASWHTSNLIFFSGSAIGSRGEGTKIKGSGERGGAVETKGPSPHDSPAREGGSDQSSPNCTTGGDEACLPLLRGLRVAPPTRTFPLNSHNRRLCNPTDDSIPFKEKTETFNFHEWAGQNKWNEAELFFTAVYHCFD